MIEIDWYKIGYKNYNFYLSRKYLCYKGKKICFQWSISFFQEVMLNFFQVINPRNPNTTYVDYIKKEFEK